MDDSKKGARIFSLWLVPFIFILHNVNYYTHLLFYEKMYWLFSLYLAIPLILYYITAKIFQLHRDLATLVVILLSILFFFFGAFQTLLVEQGVAPVLGKSYILPVLFLSVVIYLIFKRPSIQKPLRILRIMLFFFLLSECGLFLFHLPQFQQIPQLKENAALSVSDRRKDSLNIYHIIFDGYASSPALKAVFDYTNPIDSFLLANDFYLARNTKSNYNFTPYSLAATLNLSYLSLDKKDLSRDFRNYLRGAKVYKQNKVYRFFNDRGYNVTHFSILDNNDQLDNLGTFAPKEPFYSVRYQTLERILMNPWLQHKLLGAKDGDIPPKIRKSLHSFLQMTAEAKEHLLMLRDARSPLYNLTHFLLPHEPYVYSRSSLDSLKLDDLMDHKNGYIKQVEYANELIKLIVTTLKRRGHNIIIIQGDHGFRDIDFSEHKAILQNATLNAIYFPDQNYDQLYDSVSLVNTYRIILNQYFHQNLPLLKDETIIPED